MKNHLLINPMIYNIEMQCITINNPIYENKGKCKFKLTTQYTKYILNPSNYYWFSEKLWKATPDFNYAIFISNYSFSFPTNPAPLWAPAFSQGIHGGHSRSRINLGHGRWSFGTNLPRNILGTTILGNISLF